MNIFHTLRMYLVNKIRHKGSILHRYILSYIALALIPFIFLGYFFFKDAVNHLNDYIHNMYNYKFNQIVTDIDAQFQSMAINAIRIQKNSIFKTYRLDSDVQDEIDAIDYLRNMNTNLYVTNDCIFYIRGRDSLYNAEGKYTSQIYLTKKLGLSDPDALMFFMNNARTPVLRHDTINLSNSSNASVLLFVYPVSTNDTLEYDATVTYVLTQKTLLDRFHNLVGELPGDVFVVNSNESLLMQISEKESSTIVRTKQDFNNLLAEKNHISFVRTSNEIGITIYWKLPQNIFAQELVNIRNIMRIIIVIGVFICLSIALVLAYLNYRPIAKIFYKYNSPRIRKVHKNELVALGQMLDNTIDSNLALQHQIESHNKWSNRKMVLSLLMGTFDDDNTYYLDNSAFTPPENMNFVILLSDYDNQGDNIIYEIHNHETFHKYMYATELIDRQFIAVVCYCSEKSSDAQKTAVEFLVSSCKRFGLNVQIGVGNIYANGEKTKNSFMEALIAIDRIVTQKMEPIIYFDELSNHNTLDLVNSVINYINDHYFEYDMSLERISQVFQLSISYLSRIIKDYTGTGFKEYLTKCRMEKAKSLLSNEQLTVNQISCHVGYTSVSYFIKCFKSYAGVTPGNYRTIV